MQADSIQSSSSSLQPHLTSDPPQPLASVYSGSSNGGENIQVFLRMRPMNNRELNEEHAVSAWRIVDNSITLDQQLFNGSNFGSGQRFIVPAGAYATLLSPCPGGPNQSKAYQFNGCFNPEQKNTEVYDHSSIRGIVLSSLEGINGTVFMYGQTGAGKTYTMLGANGTQGSLQTRRSIAPPDDCAGLSPSKQGAAGYNSHWNQSKVLSSVAAINQARRASSTAKNAFMTGQQSSEDIVTVSAVNNTKIKGLNNGNVVSRTNSMNQAQSQSATPRQQYQQQKAIPAPLPPQSNRGVSQSAAFKTRNLENQMVASQSAGHQLHHQYSEVGQTLDDFDYIDESQASSPDLALEQFDSTFNGNADGILILSLKELFSRVKETSTLSGSIIGGQSKVYIIRCSYFEIYNDAVYDLLNTHKEQAFNEPLQLNEDIRKKEFFVRGLKEYVVESYEDCMKLLRLGEFHRHYAETRMNHQSSRSHTLFRLHVESVATSAGPDGAGTNVIRESVLNFVDLAGSEKVSNHSSTGGGDYGSIYNGATSSFISPKGSLSRRGSTAVDNPGQSTQMRVKEGQHINKSLFFLTQVIALKAEAGRKQGQTNNSEQHIPYRNSPLTKILRSSLGGNSRTAIVLCITPSAAQLEQTFSTLRFGQNARMIRNAVVANVKANNNDQELRVILSEYERRLREVENDSQQSSLKLRQIIENLMKEKDELNQRLIKANHDKLTSDPLAPVIDNRESANGKLNSTNHSSDSEANQEFSFYLWGCGLLNSALPIDKLLKAGTKRKNKQGKCFLVDYVVRLDKDSAEQNSSKMYMQSLRNTKKECRDLKQDIQSFQATIQELEDRQDQLASQINIQKEELELQDEVIEKLKADMQKANSEKSALREEIQKSRDEVQAQLEVSQSIQIQLQKVLESNRLIQAEKYGLQDELKEMEIKFRQLEQAKEALFGEIQCQKAQIEGKVLEIKELVLNNSTLHDRINQLEDDLKHLEEIRYQLNREDIITWSDAKLVDVELVLFAGIQYLNMEKGRREFQFGGNMSASMSQIQFKRCKREHATAQILSTTKKSLERAMHSSTRIRLENSCTQAKELEKPCLMSPIPKMPSEMNIINPLPQTTLVSPNNNCMMLTHEKLGSPSNASQKGVVEYSLANGEDDRDISGHEEKGEVFSATQKLPAQKTLLAPQGRQEQLQVMLLSGENMKMSSTNQQQLSEDFYLDEYEAVLSQHQNDEGLLQVMNYGSNDQVIGTGFEYDDTHQSNKFADPRQNLISNFNEAVHTVSSSSQPVHEQQIQAVAKKSSHNREQVLSMNAENIRDSVDLAANFGDRSKNPIATQACATGVNIQQYNTTTAAPTAKQLNKFLTSAGTGSGTQGNKMRGNPLQSSMRENQANSQQAIESQSFTSSHPSVATSGFDEDPVGEEFQEVVLIEENIHAISGLKNQQQKPSSGGLRKGFSNISKESQTPKATNLVKQLSNSLSSQNQEANQRALIICAAAPHDQEFMMSQSVVGSAQRGVLFNSLAELSKNSRGSFIDTRAANNDSINTVNAQTYSSGAVNGKSKYNLPSLMIQVEALTQVPNQISQSARISRQKGHAEAGEQPSNQLPSLEQLVPHDQTQSQNILQRYTSSNTGLGFSGQTNIGQASENTQGFHSQSAPSNAAARKSNITPPKRPMITGGGAIVSVNGNAMASSVGGCDQKRYFGASTQPLEEIRQPQSNMPQVLQQLSKIPQNSSSKSPNGHQSGVLGGGLKKTSEDKHVLSSNKTLKELKDQENRGMVGVQHDEQRQGGVVRQGEIIKTASALGPATKLFTEPNKSNNSGMTAATALSMNNSKSKYLSQKDQATAIQGGGSQPGGKSPFQGQDENAATVSGKKLLEKFQDLLQKPALQNIAQQRSLYQ